MSTPSLSNRDPVGIAAPVRHNSGSFIPTPGPGHVDPRAGGQVSPSNYPTLPVADRSDEA